MSGTRFGPAPMGLAFGARSGFAPGAVTDLRFDLSRYRLNGGAVAASAIDAYHTRSSSRWAEAADGEWQPLATGSAAIMPQRGYDARDGHTNTIPNPLFTGIVDQASLMANWSLIQSGTTMTFAGHGVEDGLPYVDMRVAGTPTDGVQWRLHNLGAGPAAATGQTWTTSSMCRMVAGSLTNVTSVERRLVESDASNVFLNASNSIFPVTASRLADTLGSVTRTLTQGATARLEQRFRIFATGAIDITLRFAAPQLQQRSYQMPFGAGAVAADTLVIPAADAGMAINPAASGLTMYWRGRDYPSAATFPKWFELRIDGNNRLSFERRASDGVARPVFAGPAGVSTAVNFGTLAQLPYGTEYTAVATWRADGSIWCKAGGVAPSTGTGRTMMAGTPSTIGIGNTGAGSDRINSITRRCGLIPYSLSDADALALFNQINEGL
ncbi:hypothetical protein [Pannonibacter indicus]|uniref:hypothetical protein n=1 Tax=Pannonibacter indicus TaxID=466044 RepID=UPI00391D7F00